ncbi:hypothetical protein VNI00_010535 [Paramarasmius palmivorus]|uniref:Synembryn-A n=1 Tax=Paramarasmius palmivorus TaxID=297713 RepID=A0AAW0CIK4_9AGAR
MADAFRAYSALSASSPRSDVQDVLQAIIDAPPFALEPTSRGELIQVLLKDIKLAGPKSRLTSKESAQALLAVKTLGKVPRGSEYLGSPSGLSSLLSISIGCKDDMEASCEALRCIANTMLLYDQARATFTSKDVTGGDVVVAMLNKATNPEYIFILARILFLATASRSPYIVSLVEEKHHGRTIIEIISNKLDVTMGSLLAGHKSAKEAMTDLLKFAFNILFFYPKLTNANGDWSPRLDGILPPLLRVYFALPPTFPVPLMAPLTHVIHSLITIPINRQLRPVWFGVPSSGRRMSSGHPPPPRPFTAHGRLSSPTPPTSFPNSRHSFSMSIDASTNGKQRTIDRALSVLSAGKRSLSRSPSPIPNLRPDVVQRTQDLLEICFAYYFPDGSLETKTNNEIEETLSPLLTLLTRLCRADTVTRQRISDWIVPPNLDRHRPLETRPDFLGKCLRLLQGHGRLKDSVGELLYAMCGEDAWVLSTKVGYGNVAGFLFSKGVLTAPPPPEGEGRINPMTGTYAPAQQPPNPADEMTEEEKEQEMEKLFVLFDRLERAGPGPRPKVK